MSEAEKTIRIIKKYPNRRVYDTHLSKYIKVDDLRDMVINDIDFQVIETQTKEDVTRSVLLQIILEQESDNNPLFTSENLKLFIRYYGNQHSDVFSTYLTQSLTFFSQQQEQMGQQFTELLKQNPMDSFTEFNQKGVEMWQDMQSQFFNSFQSSKPKDNDK